MVSPFPLSFRYYEAQAEALRRSFFSKFFPSVESEKAPPLPLMWTHRPRPRRFGKVLDGDIEACNKVSTINDNDIIQ